MAVSFFERWSPEYALNNTLDDMRASVLDGLKTESKRFFHQILFFLLRMDDISYRYQDGQNILTIRKKYKQVM